MAPPKRALLQGEDDGEGHKWKVLRRRGGEINVFYGRGSASQLQLRKEDKKVDAHRAARPQKNPSIVLSEGRLTKEVEEAAGRKPRERGSP